jgi:APA family basic amino acid/polyamine antiporter
MRPIDVERRSTAVPKSGLGLLRELTLWDSVLLLIGGTIGSAIFLTPSDIAREITDPRLFLSLWVGAGAITLLAGFAFAELGSMFPNAGGQYVYIREAYGQFAAFIYGWVLFTAGNSGGIAAVAVSFATFLGRAFPVIAAETAVYTLKASSGHVVWQLTRGGVIGVLSILILTLVNVFGVKRGATIQNAATLLKLGCIFFVIVAGVSLGHGSWRHFAALSNSRPTGPLLPPIGFALIALFWTYDGWEYVSWVAGEIKDPQRNIPRALICGILAVIAVYLAMNVVYLYSMPIWEIARQDALAEASASVLFWPQIGHWIALLIAVSCFGANSIAILSGARVYYAMAKDGVFFSQMGSVHPRWRTPVASLALQGVWASALTLSGRYDQIYTYFIFMMTLGYALTVAALFVLRARRPDMERPYRCFAYPWLPGAYVIIALWFLINTVRGRPYETVVGLLLAALGIPCYFYWRRTASATQCASDTRSTK